MESLETKNMPYNMINQDEPIAIQKQRIKDQMAGIILKCWQDPKFKEALIADPKTVLTSEGITINPDIDYVFVADERPKMHFIIPEPPLAQALTKESMYQAVIAGEQLILPSILC